MRRVGFALFVAMFVFCLPAAAQIFQNDGNNPDTALGTSGTRRNRYPVTGDVRNASSGVPLQKVQVNIRSDDGRIFLAALTDETGRFSFDNILVGNYTLSAAVVGFTLAEERISIEDGPVMSVQLRPRSITEAPASDEGSRPSISAHELSAPSKAREEMAKGQNLLYAKSDFQGALREFQKAIKAFPSYYEAYAQLGLAYLDLTDTANGEAALHKSIALSDEKYPQAFIFLASLYSGNQRFADAEPMARKALELDSNSWQADHELTRALVGLNRLPEAEEVARAAVKLAPDQADLYLSLINIEGKIHNYPAMLENMNAYLRIAPDGHAADQVRTIRTQLQQAMAKPPANSPQAQSAEPDNTR